MNLYKRHGSPTYYADLRDPRTKKRVRFSTGESELRAARKVAEAKTRDWQAEADDDAQGQPKAQLGYVMDIYVASLAHPGTRKQFESIAAKLFGRNGSTRWSLDPHRYMHTLTPADLENLVAARRAEGNALQTIAHELGALRAACRRATGLGMRPPATLLAPSMKNAWRVPAAPQKTRYLSLEEYQRVRAKLAESKQPDAQDLLVVLAMTGARWGEVVGLTWGQVDFDASVIKLWSPKTRTERLVPIPGPAREVLIARWNVLWAPGAVNAGCAPAAPVFPNATGGFRHTGSCRPILHAMDACGLNAPHLVERHGKATVHSLRHTFASLLMQHGAGLAEVQEVLGHTTMHMTRRYAHLSKRDTAAKLGAILGEVMGGAA